MGLGGVELACILMLVYGAEGAFTGLVRYCSDTSARHLLRQRFWYQENRQLIPDFTRASIPPPKSLTLKLPSPKLTALPPHAPSRPISQPTCCSVVQPSDDAACSTIRFCISEVTCPQRSNLGAAIGSRSVRPSPMKRIVLR